MNWTRSILDGLAMAAYFNLFAAAAALYKPRLMFPLLSVRHHQGGQGAAYKARSCRILAGGSSCGNGSRCCFTAPSARWRAGHMVFGAWR